MHLSRAPLVPISLLRQHDCFITGDTRYRAAARLQQSMWREAQGLSPGLHRPGGRRDVPAITLGSLLTPTDAAYGANFLNPAVHAFVRRTLALREEGAGLQPDRLMRNLLSSEPLYFNLLAPLALDRDLATAVFRRLMPAFVHEVTAIRFETAPSRDRADPRFLSDGSAFDAAVEVVTLDGECATVFIETKLSESLGPAARHRGRYDDASRELALHRDPDAKVLRSVALEQFWRLSLLAGLCVRRGLTSRAHLLVVHPALNRHVAVAAQLYAAELKDPAGIDPASIVFSALTLEAFVAALEQAGAATQARYLQHRYLDLTPVLERVLTLPSAPTDDPPAAPAVGALPPPPARIAAVVDPAPSSPLASAENRDHSVAPVAPVPPRPKARAKPPARRNRHKAPASGAAPARKAGPTIGARRPRRSRGPSSTSPRRRA